MVELDVILTFLRDSGKIVVDLDIKWWWMSSKTNRLVCMTKREDFECCFVENERKDENFAYVFIAYLIGFVV